MSVAASCRCGWTGGPYATAARAAAATRRHSCAAEQVRRDRAARVAARESDQGSTVGCPHGAGHEHGSRAAYVLDGCRCRPCRDANRAYEENRTRQQLYGCWMPYVDADPVREHVRSLAAAGMGWKRVAAAAGVSTGAMSKLLWGKRGSAPSHRVRAATADAILAVRADVAGGVNVASFPAVRRLQALIAAGWPQAQLAARLGLLPSNFGALLDRDAARASTVDAVRRLYRDLADADPAAHGVSAAGITRARRYAEARGWAQPGMWDDDALDAPDGQPWAPDTDIPARTAEAVIEDTEWMARAGETADGAAARLDMQPKSLERALYRAGRADLWRALRLNAEGATA